MKTAYVVKAHVEDSGRVVSDETVPLPPGPVEVTITPSAALTGKKQILKRGRALKAMLKRIDRIKTPTVPKDRKSIDEVLYG